MEKNIVSLTDSYKLTHHNMYPKGTEKVNSYFEARNKAKYDETVFFGLQYFIKEYLAGKVVTKEKIDRAEKLAAAHFGDATLFDRTRWEYILYNHDGCLPVEIRAVPEGSVIPKNNILMNVVNTDVNCAWLTNHLETLLSQVWYPSTVATLSRTVKQLIAKYLETSCDTGAKFPGIGFMLHDFGMRGASSMESAGIGGAGHLVNFLGTDTVIAMETIMEYYNTDSIPGFSVPATEHSIMTAMGKENEIDVIRNIFKKYPKGILSVVSDSFDIYNCVDNIYGYTLQEIIRKREGKLVVRPDSGEPTEVVPHLLKSLWRNFGGIVNSKGYKVLNPKVGLIWGDGLNIQKIEEILIATMNIDFSVENLVFGMGGGLLQKVNRDTQFFAFKSSAQMRNGQWFDVYKEPRDVTKVSKRGLLKLIKTSRGYETVNLDKAGDDVMRTVFLNGKLLIDEKFEDIRARATI